MDVIIPTNLVYVLFDPASLLHPSNLFNCFYTCTKYNGASCKDHKWSYDHKIFLFTRVDRIVF